MINKALTRFILLLLCNALPVGTVLAQLLPEVRSRECVHNDCQNGSGRLEMRVEFGKAVYQGEFRNGEFHGFGRLEVPISFTQKAVYSGTFDMGVRSGRGTYWNGKGNLYIGQWQSDKRHGVGSYFFGLPEWRENQHTEFWLSQNTENYTGDFVNDLYQGQGTFRWKNGSKYVGGFFANDKHGPGTFYYTTGTARQQLWEYGEFIR
jgi:hypothetical protein